MQDKGHIIGRGDRIRRIACHIGRKREGARRFGRSQFDDCHVEPVRGRARRSVIACLDDNGARFEVLKIEREFILFVGGVQRGRGRRLRDSDKSSRHFRAVGQDDCNTVTRADTCFAQCRTHILRERPQVSVGHPVAARCTDGIGRIGVRLDQVFKSLHSVSFMSFGVWMDAICCQILYIGQFAATRFLRRNSLNAGKRIRKIAITVIGPAIGLFKKIIGSPDDKSKD